MSSITVVGCGPGSVLYATGAALQAIAQADLLLGAQRLIEEFGGTKQVIVYTSVHKTLDTILRDSNKKY